MNHTLIHVRWDELLRILFSYPRRWMVPAVAIASLALVYAGVHRRPWEATQALLVRDEAATNVEGLGRFRQREDMKTVQETILELAKSRQVLAATLESMGPPADYDDPAAWPTEDDIADLRESTSVSPPPGTEFGTTEIFYVHGKDKDRDRTIALVTALCDQLQLSFQNLRNDKANSMLTELSRNVELARADLADATGRLAELEASVGSDLGELRNLFGAQANESDLRRNVVAIEGELRTIESQQRANDELLTLLRAAAADSSHLLATPNTLLTAQPALNRLKEGLIDAQIRTAQLLGDMSEAHPKVRAARNAEDEIREHIHAELAVAMRGIESEARVTDDRATALREQLLDSQQRLERLATLRTDYGVLVAEVERRTELVSEAEKNLSDVRASQSASLTSNLIARVDGPDAGNRPLGPGPLLIVLGGIVGGLATGLGVLFLTVQPTQSLVAAQTRPAAPNVPLRPLPHQTATPQPVGSLSFKQSLAKLAGRYA